MRKGAITRPNGSLDLASSCGVAGNAFTVEHMNSGLALACLDGVTLTSSGSCGSRISLPSSLGLIGWPNRLMAPAAAAAKPACAVALYWGAPAGAADGMP